MTPYRARTKALWAKKKVINNEHQWLPLVIHLTDTANVITMLYDQWLSEGQRDVLNGAIDPDLMRRVVKFTGYSHDIGKGTPAFQLKPSYDGNRFLDDELVEALVQSGFKALDSAILSSPNKSPHAMAGEAILESFGVPVSLGAVIGGHHGRPPTRAPNDEINVHRANYWQDDCDSAVQQNWREVQRELFDHALEIAAFIDVYQLPELTQPQAVMLEGLLIMADWLASSEFLDDDSNRPMFHLIPLNQGVDDIETTLRFQQAWQQWQRSDEWEPEKIRLSQLPYQQRWGFSPRPVQQRVAEVIAQADDPGLLILEAPMGMGKTEIALLSAEQLAYQQGRTGLFFGLPTQATSNAMFDRVNTWVNYLTQQEESTFSIKLMHSKAQFNDTYQALPRADNIQNESAVVVNSWFSGKKSILDEFTIGTIDHLLLLALKQKHLALRHLGLSKKVVIIDEVHAYDTYMDQYLYCALKWLGAYHVPVVILSATLPKNKRNLLIEAYFKGKYGKKLEKLGDLSKLDENWRETTAYPLVSLLDGQQLKQITDFPGHTDQQPLKIKVNRMVADESEIVDKICRVTQHGGIAGVIVNTVKRAQELAEMMPTEIETIVFHSAFMAPDRAQIERKLQASIGKNGDRPSRLVVIGTQVMEVSLDISLDVLFTDIAPMDLLLQRAGRLHRHQCKRPESLTTPKLYVMGINSDGSYEKANVDIYGQYLLMKTDHFLPEVISLPADISILVQQVYDEKTDSEIDAIDEAHQEFDRKIEAKTRKAKVFQIDTPRLRAGKSIHGWLDNKQPGVDTDSTRAEAAVRDIDESIEVILLQHTVQGDFLLDGTPLNSRLSVGDAIKTARQVIRLPHVFSYRIDQIIRELEKQTIINYPEWQESRWLQGALALRLDENRTATLGGYIVEYSSQYGLKYRKEESNE